MKRKSKIGIVGCGAIGATLISLIKKDLSDRAKVVCVSDLHDEKVREVNQKYKSQIPNISLDELIKRSDIVIEAASSKIAKTVAIKVLKKNKTCLILSIGGLLQGYRELSEVQERSKGCLLLPSGALAGIDAIEAVQSVGIQKVVLTTTKPPQGLKGAPYLEQKNISLSKIKKRKVIFEGSALQAAKAFPKNINVAALLAIKTLGPRRTKVRVEVDPAAKRNKHHICVEGRFGKIETVTENVPTPSNPKTSYLAILTAFNSLKKYLSLA